MKDYCFGFTGTRHGMTLSQKAAFRDFLGESVGILHHGMCIGADADAHNIAQPSGYYMVGHPPTNKSLLAALDCEEIWAPAPYLDRNKDIVRCGHALIATPFEAEEQPRGGTWSTIRYACRHGKPTVIIFPDGTIKQSDNRRTSAPIPHSQKSEAE